ncbi:MAG TPA: hypothetical protein VF406_19335 [Thermodesulfobacteriota bacterium]
MTRLTRRRLLVLGASALAPAALGGCGATTRVVPGTTITLRGGPMQGLLLARAERHVADACRQLSTVLGDPPAAPLEVRLVSHFSSPAGPGAAARYLPAERVIEVQLATSHDPLGDLREFRACIWHEYVHVLLHDRTGGEPLPAWFDEGVAEYFGRYGSGIDWRPESRGGAFLEVVRTRRVPRFFEIDRLFYAADHARAYTAYAFAYTAAALLVARFGDSAPALVAEAVRQRYTVGGALRRLYGTRLADFEAEWQASLITRYAT